MVKFFSQDVYKLTMFIVIFSCSMWLYIGIFMPIAWPLRLTMIIIGILALCVLPCPDVYAPHLGEAMLPAGVLDNTLARGNVAIQLTGLPPNVKVVFWSESSETSKKPVGGVTTTSAGGVANITLFCKDGCGSAVSSRLGIDKVLPSHVFFRYEVESGMLSRVYSERIVSE